LKKRRKESRLAYPDFMQVKQVKYKDLDGYFALFFRTFFLHRSQFFSSIRLFKGNKFHVSMQQDFINGQFCPVFGGFDFDFGKISDFFSFLPMGRGAGAQGVQRTHCSFASGSAT